MGLKNTTPEPEMRMSSPSTLEILILIAAALIVFGLVGMANGGAAEDEIRGDLYAFCDTDWAEICDQKALMLKDVCEETVREWTDGSDRFSCAVVDDSTRNVYMSTVDRDVYERTIEAWIAGR
jgi:hypothetical protein